MVPCMRSVCTAALHEPRPAFLPLGRKRRPEQIQVQLLLRTLRWHFRRREVSLRIPGQTLGVFMRLQLGIMGWFSSSCLQHDRRKGAPEVNLVHRSPEKQDLMRLTTVTRSRYRILGPDMPAELCNYLL